jgi:hypothetical protein
MFLKKLVVFIAVSAPLTDDIVNRFILVKSIGRAVPANSQVLILDEQAIDRLSWYGQVVDRFNLKSSFSSFKPDES